MGWSPLPPLRRSERATLAYSYTGEFGRGAFTAVRTEFVLLVAVSTFGLENRWLLGMLPSAAFAGMVAALLLTSACGRWRKKTVVRVLEIVSR
jgi:hypothetical protein